MRSGGLFSVELLEQRAGFAVLYVTGKGATRAFSKEAGGHRWQRIPPTEKRGRVHTSTITVAVLREPDPTEVVILEEDIEVTTCRASGKGGQHLQKTDSAVQIKHLPSNLIVRCESERSQHRNRESAMTVLRARLLCAKEAAQHNSENSERRAQLGSGMRGDKRRTIREQDGIVTDHVLGVRVSLKAYLRGDFGDIESS